MLRNMKSELFCFKKNSVTDIFRVKADDITTTITLHMFVVMLTTTICFIPLKPVSKINSSKSSYLAKEFYITKDTRSSNIWKELNHIFTLKQMHIFHCMIESEPFWSYFFSRSTEHILYIHK